ncbi:PorP/SprF family type IX secretion system membrane protein [Flavobacterium humi]|uniref:Type IX secretion system membrane protein PorP/SprF n=1 Tax=Flavobacterium humi TaxID=2562683 RepID=A0A4Z0LAU6_9FLAO|nr:type IX secretion system membrane protein PorP/SprF [Flavobacterium humi]TGD58627.1 type IX secretion system membrane protein PorP/SprF [Flavobacterium humi]
MISSPNRIVNKGKLLIAVLLLSFTKNVAQELNVPVATQYLADNPFVLSPTYAGIGDNFRIRANGFAQWVGIKDSPRNQALYADFRIADQSGVGASFYNDKNGFTRQTGAKLSFAHHIILDYYSKQYLSFGISFNINNFRIDTENFNIVDPSITNDRFTSNNNFDVGLLYRRKAFFFSVNASNILNKDTKKFYMAEPNLLRNYQIFTGYTYKSDRDSRVEIEPSAYFQYFQSDGRSSTDLNAKIRYYDNQRTGYFWLGATYRFLNDQPLKPLTLGPMIGIKKQGFYVGYSYQLTLNELANYNSGTHMITIGLDFLQKASNCPCTQKEVD